MPRLQLEVECDVDCLEGTLDVEEARELAVVRAAGTIARGELLLRRTQGGRDRSIYLILDQGGGTVGSVILDTRARGSRSG